MSTRAMLVVPLVCGSVVCPALACRSLRPHGNRGGALSRWKTPCPTMEFSLGAPPPVSDSQGYFEAASAAGAAWSQAALDGVNRCTNVIFTVVSVPDVAGQWAWTTTID